MLEIFIEYENINSAGSGSNPSSAIDNYIIATGFFVLVAIASAAYVFKSKKEEIPINVDNSSILVPVELIAEGEIDSVDENRPAFSILQGSQFSRNVVFVCEGGCQSEFEIVDDEETEIMCPHCGLIGDSPL
tara:strand:- start:682 stop:1077 length:396 start_codon:yes stop_codon:yes gene_type:complete